jgi:hypothetical protein
VKSARLANSSGVWLAIESQLAEKKKQLLYRKKKMYISQHHFGQHEGHLRDEANDIAKESGAWHVNYTDPCTGLKRGWFATSTVDGTNSGEVEQNVMRKVQVIGGFKALRKPQVIENSEKYLAIFSLPSEGHDSGRPSNAPISQFHATKGQPARRAA